MKDEYEKFEVVMTAIIIKPARPDDPGRSGGDATYLLEQRSHKKKRYPLRWTVPGGHLDFNDFKSLPQDAHSTWYNVLERALKREVKEEVNIEIENIEYITSLIISHDDGHATLVISCIADYKSGEVTIQEEEVETFVWATFEEAKSYDLMDGILDELVMAENKRKGIKTEWQRFN